MITYSKALLLTALGVMFCSGCTPEQQTPAPPELSGQETSVQQTPDPGIQSDDGNMVHQTPAAKEPTVDVGRVKAQLEQLGAEINVNEQGEIYGVTGDTEITDAGLVHLKGLTSLRTLLLRNTQITDAGVAKFKEALPGHESRAGETGGFGGGGFGAGGITIFR